MRRAAPRKGRSPAQATAADDDTPAALDEAGQRLVEGELDAALDRLAKLPGTASDALLYRAFLERQRGLYATSEATLTQVIGTTPDDAPALLQRAYTRWIAGDLHGANRDFAAIEAAVTTSDPALRERARTEHAGLLAQQRELEPIASALERLVALQWGGGALLVLLAATVTWRTRHRAAAADGAPTT